uniref:Uncharacterized protein n=1 Tax=Strigamia maritima TaxID=126957 RepID=T1JF85_STRMM
MVLVLDPKNCLNQNNFQLVVLNQVLVLLGFSEHGTIVEMEQTKNKKQQIQSILPAPVLKGLNQLFVGCCLLLCEHLSMPTAHQTNIECHTYLKIFFGFKITDSTASKMASCTTHSRLMSGGNGGKTFGSILEQRNSMNEVNSSQAVFRWEFSYKVKSTINKQINIELMDDA